MAFCFEFALTTAQKLLRHAFFRGANIYFILQGRVAKAALFVSMPARASFVLRASHVDVRFLESTIRTSNPGRIFVKSAV
jgi:hypothetical protein